MELTKKGAPPKCSRSACSTQIQRDGEAELTLVRAGPVRATTALVVEILILYGSDMPENTDWSRSTANDSVNMMILTY